MDRDDIGPSRRQVVCGIATAMAATVAATAATAATAETNPKSTVQGTSPSTAPRNPVTAHPKPPFPRQSQEWPGLLLDYASTKAAIVGFTKSLAKQVAKRGVRVSAVAPGPYWTPLQVTGGAFQDKVVTFGEDTPLGRPGQPVEIAPVYVLLASAEATDITGQVFGASGGRGQP